MSKKIGTILLCLTTFFGCQNSDNNLKISTKHACEAYTSFTCNIPVEIRLTNTKDSIEIEASESLQKDFRISVDEKKMTITVDKLLFRTWHETPRIWLPIPEHLDSIELMAATLLSSDCTLKSQSLKLKSKAAALVAIDIETDTLRADLGLAKIDLSGTTNVADIVLNNCEWHAFALSATNYICTLKNSTVGLHCDSTLTIAEGFRSVVNYTGDCTVDIKKKSGFIINRVEE